MRTDSARDVVLPSGFTFVPDRSTAKTLNLPHTVQLPHKASALDDIGRTFSEMSALEPEHVFILAPLHGGKVGYDSEDCIYRWEEGTEIEGTIADDDVCGEEFSADMLLPFIHGTFPDVPVQALFATGDTPKAAETREKILKDFPKSILIISNNMECDCAGMWLDRRWI